MTNTIKAIWYLVEGLVFFIFDIFVWSAVLAILAVVAVVASIIILPVFHGYAFVNKIKGLK